MNYLILFSAVLIAAGFLATALSCFAVGKKWDEDSDRLLEERCREKRARLS